MQTPDRFLKTFRETAGAGGAMPFDRFMALALYHPELGYYRRPGDRVGYGHETDFFTAQTSGPVFGELAIAAVAHLLAGRDPAGLDFVEIGAEPNSGGVLAGLTHPFRSGRTIRADDELKIAGDCVVFSNELFDAQPFRRFVFRGGGWKERGVAAPSDALVEVELPPALPPPPLPPAPLEGQVFDAPTGARDLLRRIAAQPWRGLFVAFDYGRSFAELADLPEGTARAYHRHTQSNDLLARPGEQDLTCHVCWDWLVDELRAAGFNSPTLQSQESFFVHHASAAAEAIIARDATGVGRQKLSLMQLLHPAHLGQKFQVLHALR